MSECVCFGGREREGDLPPKGGMERAPTSFTVLASGALQTAEIPGCGNAYCKIAFYHGDDWQLLDVRRMHTRKNWHSSSQLECSAVLALRRRGDGRAEVTLSCDRREGSHISIVANDGDD